MAAMLNDQGTSYPAKKDTGGWTTIKTAGTDVDTGEAPWHSGAGVQPKTELTNQIWVNDSK